ncbi:MAG: matrixin family metalloprotease, partial [Planctomycetaceae bacterium]|nr:matrixin family metalloprotease [Planctomycetaceae bacterium]
MLLSQFVNFPGWTSGSGNLRRRLRSQWLMEGLEVRSLLTTFAWSDVTNLTISFPPDGTDISGSPNELNSELNHLGTPEEWQSTIVHGFQTWLNELGFDITVVSDSGAKFGASGATHGDSRFGDVRVGAVPLSSGTLATAVPQDTFVSGTWAGDMMLNSTAELTSLDELYALSLHEAGHILGLDHSTDPNSPMFDHGGTTVLQPTAQDIALLKSLYSQSNGGQRETEEDSFSDEESGRVVRIEAVEPNGMYPHFEAAGTITDPTDIDTFVFTPDDIPGADPRITTILLRTTTPDLIPKVTLLTASGRRVDSTVVANGNGLVILQSREVEADHDYVVQVESAFTDPRWSQGGYELGVTFSESSQTVERLARGTLDREKTRKSFDFNSEKTQLFNFVLATKGSDSKKRTNQAAVVLSVVDERERVVFRALGIPGQTASDNTVMLREGHYRIIVEVVAASDRSIPEIEFSVLGSGLSLDAGPLPTNPVGNPVTGPILTVPYDPPPVTP